VVRRVVNCRRRWARRSSCTCTTTTNGAHTVRSVIQHTAWLCTVYEW